MSSYYISAKHFRVLHRDPIMASNDLLLTPSHLIMTTTRLKIIYEKRSMIKIIMCREASIKMNVAKLLIPRLF